MEQALQLPRRMRRNRLSATIRDLVKETHLDKKNLIQPIFITEEQTEPIQTMPGIFRYTIDDSFRFIENSLSLGIATFALFCHIPSHKKDPLGQITLQEDQLYATSIRQIKTTFPEIVLIADVALDPFTDHGFDGILSDTGYVKNDETVHILAKMAYLAAVSGADVIAPSDMMDGRIKHIRSFLDEKGYFNTTIMSYAVKFASALYTPFRHALESTPKKGDKQSFQVNTANSREALLECLLDEQEGADLLLIKPGLPALDIITTLRQQTLLPIGAYQVSGEYSMIKAAAKESMLDEKAVFLETLLAMKRAGASFIITYAATQVAQYL